MTSRAVTTRPGSSQDKHSKIHAIAKTPVDQASKRLLANMCSASSISDPRPEQVFSLSARLSAQPLISAPHLTPCPKIRIMTDERRYRTAYRHLGQKKCCMRVRGSSRAGRRSRRYSDACSTRSCLLVSSLARHLYTEDVRAPLFQRAIEYVLGFESSIPDDLLLFCRPR